MRFSLTSFDAARAAAISLYVRQLGSQLELFVMPRERVVGVAELKFGNYRSFGSRKAWHGLDRI